jgi:hypothetical protein
MKLTTLSLAFLILVLSGAAVAGYTFVNAPPIQPYVTLEANVAAVLYVDGAGYDAPTPHLVSPVQSTPVKTATNIHYEFGFSGQHGVGVDWESPVFEKIAGYGTPTHNPPDPPALTFAKATQNYVIEYTPPGGLNPRLKHSAVTFLTVWWDVDANLGGQGELDCTYALLNLKTGDVYSVLQYSDMFANEVSSGGESYVDDLEFAPVPLTHTDRLLSVSHIYVQRVTTRCKATLGLSGWNHARILRKLNPGDPPPPFPEGFTVQCDWHCQILVDI